MHPWITYVNTKLWQRKKSDLTNILALKTQKEPSGLFDVRMLDATAVALVHLLQVTDIITIDYYASGVFVPHIRRQFETSMRVDVVWDRYQDNNIKASIREKRGKVYKGSQR